MDEEWVKLIIEAKKLGITIDEIRIFFNSKKPLK
ncbi:anti-repressor SinI family protein [Cytobacillus kochii]|nr:anti-repressor SinI family protein [Cytobacillus kochii]